MLLVVLAAMIPVLMAARVMPTGSEIADRLGTFLFLALSLLVARDTERWSRLRRVSKMPSWSHRHRVIAHSLALVLATGMFVGGYLMGSGPAWIRLPGPYVVDGDRRSMDSETLAAVHWARDELPPGRLIGAERVSSVLLASQAGLFPVMNDDVRDVPSLYFADNGARGSPSSYAACTCATFMSIGGWPTTCHILASISTGAKKTTWALTVTARRDLFGSLAPN